MFTLRFYEYFYIFQWFPNLTGFPFRWEHFWMRNIPNCTRLAIFAKRMGTEIWKFVGQGPKLRGLVWQMITISVLSIGDCSSVEFSETIKPFFHCSLLNSVCNFCFSFDCACSGLAHISPNFNTIFQREEAREGLRNRKLFLLFIFYVFWQFLSFDC